MPSISAESENTLNELPLHRVRVLEISTGKVDMCGRILADLGADVVLVEPESGSPGRSRPPFHLNESLYFASHSANKRSVCLDLTDSGGQSQFLQLIQEADILIESTPPGTMAGWSLGSDVLHNRNPQLVILSISDFGQTGPYRDFSASNSVQLAMAGMLCRSGLPGREPLLPPGDLAWECSAVQAAWVVLVSYWQSQHIGVGDHVDFSLFEATAQILDPIMGVTGSAAAGKSSMQLAESRDRPKAGSFYPIFRCKDGFVRMCILNPRQWQGMSEWLGPDHPFSGPEYGNLFTRMKVMDQIVELISNKLIELNAVDIVREAQLRGVPTALLAQPEDVLNDEHFQARGAWTHLTLSNDSNGILPSGYLEIDNQRMGVQCVAPKLGQHTDKVLQEWLNNPASRNQKSSDNKVRYCTGSKRRPLEGIRVLDLGVIVAGAELGRILSDQGAEVIKVENQAFPDGSRQSGTKDQVSISFAQGHRGKESLGLNLRSPKGVEIFKQLAAKSDIIVSNFKPGTLEKLGLGYDLMREINPSIIMADSSALGRTGPLSKSMGYGPLVRASTGLTGQWRYTDDDASFSDGITIVPDHLAARVSAIGIMALLARRLKTDQGGEVSVSQAESLLNVFTTQFLRESVEPGSLKALGNHNEFSAPNGLFPCAGDDEWCVISIETDDQWQRFCQLIERPDLSQDANLKTASDRLRARDRLNQQVSEWTRQYSPVDVMNRLQAANISAGAMFRLPELDKNPHLYARNFIAHLQQPGNPEIWPTENAPALSDNLPDPDIRPAPLQGQHTREVISRVLGMPATDIEALIESGDLEI